MRKTGIVIGLWGAFAVGCGFDPSGSGDGTDGETETDGSTSGTATAGTTGGVTLTSTSSSTTTTASSSATTDEGSSGVVDDGSGPGSSEAGPGTGGSTSTTDPSAGSSSEGDSSTGDVCAVPPPFAEIYLSAGATVVDPMQLTMSMMLPGEPEVAFSPVAEAGTITYEFTTECPGTFYVWGLVFDSQDGATNNGYNNGADSFFYAVDGDATLAGDVWVYGCQTDGNPDDSWSWQPVQHYIEPSCVVEDWSMDLAAGTHTFQLLNREDSNGGNDIAAIHSIVISNDSAFDPNTLYMP